MSKSIKLFLFITVCFSFLLCGSQAFAVPVDLSGFIPDENVSESGGTVTFTETFEYGAIYFANDSFAVGATDTSLSFDYSLTLGDMNDDWLVAIIDDGFDYVYEMEIGTTGSGSWEIDLTGYQSMTISLAFGLESNDFDIGTTAIISNIDLATVPEPATIMLLGISLIGLFVVGRKRVNQMKS